MKSVYFEDDDILQIRVSDKPIVREISQGWNTNISFAEDGSIVEIVLLDAKKEGLLPLELKRAAQCESVANSASSKSPTPTRAARTSSRA